VTDDVDVRGDVVLRIAPRRSLLVSALASILVVLLPVSALLYWFAIPRGQAVFVAIAQAIVVGAAITILLRQLTVDTVVTETELRGRGIFSPMVRVPLDRIVSVVTVPTYLGQAPEPVKQLLVRDAAGRRLYRLRGNYWHPGDLQKVAAALPVATTVVTEPMSVKEFYAAYPGSAYWFENRPLLMAGMLAVVIAVCVSVAMGVMQLLDMPIMG
jgi:hypothetical protein